MFEVYKLIYTEEKINEQIVGGKNIFFLQHTCLLDYGGLWCYFFLQIILTNRIYLYSILVSNTISISSNRVQGRSYLNISIIQLHSQKKAFNPTVNNISIISWRSVLLVEETTNLSQVTAK
jgi:hypothetical protein